MAEESNGKHDWRERMSRIEAALELFIRDHEQQRERQSHLSEAQDRLREEHLNFRAEHKMLLRAQVVQQGNMDALTVKMEEIADKLDGLIGAVDQMRQDTDLRLRRLEGDPPAA